ncbi:MAG: E3 binding domain-containing protein, partial [Verrucomicrobiota bacterium]
MATIIEMPKLSDTMTVGTLVKWLKNEGDPIESGDMIAEVETDKATMEVEVFEDGVLLKQYCGSGEEVEVGGPIAAIGESGEEVPAATGGTSATATESAPPATEEKKPKPAAEKTEAAPAPAVETPAPATAPAAAAPTEGRVKASPLAKKIAAEKGIDLSSIQGSGPGGRILKDDVLNAKPVAAAPAESVPSKEKETPPAATLEALELPVSNMRKSIGKALVASKTQAPHFYLQIQVDGGPLAALRA